MTTDNKLVPILREAINIVKIVTYKTIKTQVTDKYKNIESGDCNKISGIIINIIFGTPSSNDHLKSLQLEYKAEIQELIEKLPVILGDFCNIITDTLRIQILCDGYNNMDSTELLKQADQLKILIKDRELPLPNNFIAMVRELGGQHGLLAPLD